MGVRDGDAAVLVPLGGVSKMKNTVSFLVGMWIALAALVGMWIALAALATIKIVSSSEGLTSSMCQAAANECRETARACSERGR